jgi:hypothetical protein
VRLTLDLNGEVEVGVHTLNYGGFRNWDLN